ncbi:fumarylacetoacetate hydrolase family protein [Pseudonocardia yuanmonensis]|uniref:Fumarylacetoacetate hydrolase family protein n=1 Tax=Pseudonocardia yuanmonensis TaxID=1095914 RepID=A0ABP8XPT3_9PSEU
MRWITYSHREVPTGAPTPTSAGLVVDDTVLGTAPGTRVRDLLADPDPLEVIGERLVKDPHEVVPLAGVRLHAPIPDPPTVRDFVTFERHIEGAIKLAGGDPPVPPQWYKAPTFYFTNPYSVLGPEDDVPLSPGTTLFDLELEVAVVIGEPGRDISADRAERHIAGFCIMNDWTARDLQFAEMEVRLGPAKGKDTSLTLGPMLVTPDELAARRSGTAYDLEMTASINGEVIGRDSCSSMNWSFAEMIEYASRGTEVRAGDVLGSGTCGGGCLAELWGRNGLDAHAPLRPGDVVEVAVQELGTLRSRIVEYPSA